MTTRTFDIVARLWNLCHVLRGDGVSYQDYVTELTFLLFLKMMQETEREERIPADYRWTTIARREGVDQLDHYRRALLDLGKAPDPTVQAIFTDAQTKLRKPANLKTLTTAVDELDWFSARDEGLGDLYEGLLEKNASEKKSGAGQYFTPRPLIDCIVRVMKPQAGEVVQDPAAGTGGFLVAADHYIKAATDDLFALPPGASAYFQRTSAFTGVELVPETHRLAMMNLMLHGIESSLVLGDSLSPDGEALGQADLILTNPPFGTKAGGGRPSRQDFSVTADTANKQLAFIEHVVRGLKPGGRAAVVVPDNVLYEESTGRPLRRWVMELADLHTILRLPTGIFYAQGVKTNVLFLRRGTKDRGSTKAIWVYDMRSNGPAYGKTRPLTAADFDAFEAAYGTDPNGTSHRMDQGVEGRFRCFTRAEIAARDENLEISWLQDSDTAEDNLSDPEDICAAIVGHLRAALIEMEGANETLVDEQAPSDVGEENLALPQGWVETTLGSLSKYITSGSRDWSQFYADRGALFVRTQDINRNTITSIDNIARVALPERIEGKRTLISQDDILITITGANVGKCAHVREPLPEAYVSQSVALVRLHLAELAPFLQRQLIAPAQGSQRSGLEQSAYGVGRPVLSLENVRNVPIRLPPLAEQKRILAKLDALSLHTTRARMELGRGGARGLLDRLDQSILAKAFRGELVPQDPADEPASALLERIRAERASSPAKAGRGRRAKAA